MRIQRPARRIRKLDNLFKLKGGIRVYTLRRLDKEGMPIEKVAAELTEVAEEPIPVHTLYQWVRKWRRELADTDAREETIASR